MPLAKLNDWNSLDPSSLRHQITIQSVSSTQDAAGQPISTWNNVLTTRASIDVVTAREQAQNMQLTSQVTHLIKMRWTNAATIAPGMQVLYSTHVYKIQDVENVSERNRIIKLSVLAINDAE